MPGHGSAAWPGKVMWETSDHDRQLTDSLAASERPAAIPGTRRALCEEYFWAYLRSR